MKPIIKKYYPADVWQAPLNYYARHNMLIGGLKFTVLKVTKKFVTLKHIATGKVVQVHKTRHFKNHPTELQQFFSKTAKILILMHVFLVVFIAFKYYNEQPNTSFFNYLIQKLF